MNGTATAVGATVSKEGFKGFENYLQKVRKGFEAPEDESFDAMLKRAVDLARANGILAAAPSGQ